MPGEHNRQLCSGISAAIHPSSFFILPSSFPLYVPWEHNRQKNAVFSPSQRREINAAVRRLQHLECAESQAKVRLSPHSKHAQQSRQRLGLRRQSTAATALSPAPDANKLSQARARTKAARRGTSRRSPKMIHGLPSHPPIAPACVPQEHLKIARSFNCGCSDRNGKIPQGRSRFSKYIRHCRQPAPTDWFRYPHKPP